MWICAHASLALGCQFAEFRIQAALRIEELFRTVAPEPVFKLPEMLGRRGWRYRERYLVRTEGTFDLQAIHHFRPRPAFGRIEDNHRPARPGHAAVEARILLNFLDLLDRRIECRRHGLVHKGGFVTLDEVGCPP